MVDMIPMLSDASEAVEAWWDTGRLGELAVRVTPITDDVPVPMVDGLFRRDPGLSALAVRRGNVVRLLTRDRLEFELAGPFGYGRNLYARKPVSALLPETTLTLTADTPLSLAGSAILVRDEADRYSDVLVTFADGGFGIASVTAVFARLAQVFETIATHDPLTNLPNRRVLEQVGKHLFGNRTSSGVALLYVDLDRFKDVNDLLGHRAGDAVLVEFARRLRQCTREDDLIVRLGGDEFAVLLRDATPVIAHAAAERIVLNAAAPFVIDGRIVTLGASVGVAFPDHATEERSLSAIDVLIRDSDSAMYQAKRSGRSVVGTTELPALDTGRGTSAGAIGRRIRPALDAGLFELHYQPIIDIATGRTVEMEALLRWDDTELGPLTPAEFIPVAERSGLIIELGRWVIRTACAQGRHWSDTGSPRSVAVNLSPLQLMDPELVSYVRTVLSETGFPAGLLRFEITESEAIRDVTATTSRLRELRTLGVQLSLDDFGTGYSSLAMLRQLPIDTIKIDRSFVDRIDRDGDDVASDTALVRLVIETARMFGFSVVAEGVERRAQLDQLTEMGCASAQGFLFGRPARPATDHRTVLRINSSSSG
jgi:diguanylate cyclase (GGDEF)-like protein